jgi:hypothetical protein
MVGAELLEPGAGAAADRGRRSDADAAEGDDRVEDETEGWRAEEDADATDDTTALIAAYEPGTIGILVAENPDAMYVVMLKVTLFAK